MTEHSWTWSLPLATGENPPRIADGWSLTDCKVAFHIYGTTPGAMARLDELEGKVNLMDEKLGLLGEKMAVVDAETTRIAGVVQELRDAAAADEPAKQELLDRADATIAALKAIGKDPENPVPAPVDPPAEPPADETEPEI